MGQRLVITMKDNGKALAIAYYHWSAYTISSYGLVEPIVQAILATETPEDKKLFAIRLLEMTGAGLYDENEMLYANQKYPTQTFNAAIDRNEGFICISKDGINDMMNWGEDYIDIDLGKKQVKFMVWGACTESEYQEYYPDDENFDNVETLELPAKGKSMRTLSSWLDYNDFLQLYDGADLECGKYYGEIDDEDGKPMRGILTAIC